MRDAKQRPEQFKDSPLGRIPNDWEVERVADLGEVRVGRQRSPHHLHGPNQWPYLRVANVFDGHIDYSDVYSMAFSTQERNILGLRPSDILLNEGQSIELVGRSAMYEGEPGKYCFQNSLIRFRSGPKIDARFASLVFRSWLPRGRFAAVALQTTSVAHLSGERFGGMLFLVAHRDEQRRIAEVLDTLDEAIRKTEQLIQKLKQMKQGLLHDLLTRGIDENGELRDPERHPEKFKDSPLGRIPKRWDVVHLNTVLNGIDAGWSPACDETPPSIGEWGILKVSAVTSGEFLSNESKTLPANLRPRPELEVRGGDILIARANGVADLVGVCAEVRRTPARLMLSDKVLRLRTKAELLEPSFLGFVLKSPVARRQIESAMSGSSGQKNISQTQIGMLLQPLPRLWEQRQILCILESVTSQIADEQSGADKLRVMKVGLMEDLLTGRVRTTVLDGTAP